MGHQGPEKLKTLFQRHRVPLWERRNWPVIVSRGVAGETLVWSRGFGPAVEFAAGRESRTVLEITEV
ncbi:MAG: tRNA lysidine(34) synthetase TilS [Acidobacteria bacterium]|nr:tRNA lysidine(34) synthetase TilS [Acidobacteriota bacterium]